MGSNILNLDGPVRCLPVKELDVSGSPQVLKPWPGRVCGQGDYL